MVRFDEERNAKFIDEFKVSAPWLWDVSGPEYHRGEVRNCDMWRKAAAIREYWDNLMTGERSKIRSGEFLVFRLLCRCACVSVWMCHSKKLFSFSICVCPDQKYSLSDGYMLLKLYQLPPI